MILEDHQKFASPGEALEHVGVKGMRWGVRKARDTSGAPRKRSKKKKAAIAVGALTVAAGAGFVALTLSRSGSTPMSAVKASGDAASVASFLAKSGSSGKDATEAAKYAEMFLKTAGR